MTKSDRIMMIAICCILGLYVISSVCTLFELIIHPEHYSGTAMPWYLTVVLKGCLTCITVAGIMLAKKYLPELWQSYRAEL